MLGFEGAGVGGEGSVEESWGRGIYGAGEEHEAVGEYVGRKAQDGVAVDTRMFEVDASRAIRTDDNLKLVATKCKYEIRSNERFLYTLSYHLFVQVPT